MKILRHIIPLTMVLILMLIFSGCGGSDEGSPWTLGRIATFGDKPVYSPDGAKVVFAGVNSGSTGIWLYEYGVGVAQLLEMPVNYDYAWAPGSDQIVFSNPSAGSDGGLWISDLEGNLTQIYTDGRNPDWSPEGNMIIFQDGAGEGLLAIEPSGANPQQLLFVGESPKFSPAGGKAAFIRRFTEPLVIDSLYILDLQTNAYSKIAPAGVNYSWSPEGDYIAFERYESPGGSGYQLNLKKVNVNSGTVSVLWQGGSAPDWSPSGDKIVFRSLAGDVEDGILMMSSSGANVEEITGTGETPCFGNSANKVTYASNSGIWLAQR